MRSPLLLLPLLFLSACAVSVYQYQTAPDEARLAPYAKEGAGTIVGQAFLKTAGGDVKFAAGNEIILVPVTPYTSEWFTVGVVQQQVTAPMDPIIKSYTRMVRGDAEGRFKFTNLPAGNYYIATDIKWFTGSEYTGGTAYAQVALGDGETVEVIVTRP